MTALIPNVKLKATSCTGPYSTTTDPYDRASVRPLKKSAMWRYDHQPGTQKIRHVDPRRSKDQEILQAFIGPSLASVYRIMIILVGVQVLFVGRYSTQYYEVIGKGLRVRKHMLILIIITIFFFTHTHTGILFSCGQQTTLCTYPDLIKNLYPS